MTASIGVALTRPADGEDPADALWRLVDRADAAMYEAKQQGRDRVAALAGAARPVAARRGARALARHDAGEPPEPSSAGRDPVVPAHRLDRWAAPFSASLSP